MHGYDIAVGICHIDNAMHSRRVDDRAIGGDGDERHLAAIIGIGLASDLHRLFAWFHSIQQPARGHNDLLLMVNAIHFPYFLRHQRPRCTRKGYYQYYSLHKLKFKIN